MKRHNYALAALVATTMAVGKPNPPSQQETIPKQQDTKPATQYENPFLKLLLEL